MTQSRPDHIAPPPGVLRRVLIMCVIVLSIGPIVWGLWALEAERRIAALRAQIEAETPPPPPCCKVGPEVPYDETCAYWANQARRRLPSKNPTYGISYELPEWERPTQLECHTVVFAARPVLESMHRAAAAVYCGFQDAPPPPVVWGVTDAEPWIATAIFAAHSIGDDELALGAIRDCLAVHRRSVHSGREPCVWGVGRFASGAVRGLGAIADELAVTSATRPVMEDLIIALLDDTPRHSSQLGIRIQQGPWLDLSVNTLAMWGIPIQPRQRWFSPSLRYDGHLFALESQHQYEALAYDTYTDARAYIAAKARDVGGRYISGLRGTFGFDLVEPYYETLAERRAAAIRLAIRLYVADHGRRPALLAALAPGYLAEVPGDPFADDGGVFSYSPDDGQLWSANPRLKWPECEETP